MKPKLCAECEFRVGSEFILKSEHGKILSENRILRVNYEKLKEEYETFKRHTDFWKNEANNVILAKNNKIKEFKNRIPKEDYDKLYADFQEYYKESVPKEKVRKVLDIMNKELKNLENADEYKITVESEREQFEWLKKQLFLSEDL